MAFFSVADTANASKMTLVCGRLKAFVGSDVVLWCLVVGVDERYRMAWTQRTLAVELLSPQRVTSRAHP